MTWTTAIADGSCNFGLWLEIVGFGVFGTVKHTPTDSWCDEYSTEGRVYPWLEFDSIDGWREEVDFLEATLKVSGITPRIVDVDGGMTALFKHYRGGAYTRLGAALPEAWSTITVDDAGEFNSSGLLWINQECCKYTGKTATSFTGVTRGYLGTQDVAHDYNIEVLPPIRPVVGDNTATLVGRRAYLHFAEYDTVTDTYSATEIIYRGRVRKGIKVQGGVYTIPIEHISEGLKQKIGRGLGEAKLFPHTYGYQDAASSNRSIGNLEVKTAATTLAFDVTVTTGTYNEGSLLRELRKKWLTALTGYLTTGWFPWIEKPEERVVIRSGTSAGYTISFDVKEHDPLWCLGFDPGPYSKNVDSEGLEWEAQNEARPLMIECGSGHFTISAEQYGQIRNLSSSFVYIPGDGHPLLRVKSTGDKLIKVAATDSTYPYNLMRSNKTIVCKDTKELALRDCVPLGGQIDNIIAQCYGLESPIASTASRYYASGLLSSDFDFTELSSAYIGQAWSLWNNYHLVTKETEIQRLVGPTLAVLGICPRITDSGKIGWASLEAPTELEANSIEVDSDLWANIEAAKIASDINSTPLVNIITVKINSDFLKKGEFQDEINCFNIDGLNELGETRRLTYETMIKEWYVARADDIADRLNERFTTFHFPIFGRESATVEIPCNWRSKQIKCGDLVKITHELIYDTPRGTIGVTDALGLVVGRKLALTGGNDILRIRIFSGDPWKAVAPTALATSYSSTSAYMTCSSVSLYSKTGDTDLTYFTSSSPVNVRLYPYNVSGSTSYLATVTSVVASTKRIYFSSAPLTTAEWTTSGFWVVFADWGNRTSSAVDGFAYLCDDGAVPSLGTSTSQPHRWGP